MKRPERQVVRRLAGQAVRRLASQLVGRLAGRTVRHRLAAVRLVVRDRIAAARRHPRRTLARVAVVSALLTAGILIVLPLLWLFSAALRPADSMTFPPSLVPPTFTVENLRVVLLETGFTTYFRNSIVVSAATVALTVAVATPAGYALSRYDLPHQRTLLLGVVVIQMIPIVALVTPLYRLFSVVGLLDTLAVIVLTDTVLVVPVGVWLIKGYFDTLSPRLEEAARVGGATRLRAFLVVVPLARPAIAATAIYAFVVSWNQFVVPLTFTTGRATWTFPVGLYQFISRRGVVDWTLLGAASLWAFLPLLLVVVVFQRHLVAGLSGGGFGGT